MRKSEGSLNVLMATCVSPGPPRARRGEVWWAVISPPCESLLSRSEEMGARQR